ncbi:dUTPase [uncultured Planococcus sp.]|uniref:dUTPase n=1 Tax=uncultured Planococcus sp. TaxID=337815 RepID=UPI00261EDE64|nr:dUTPase [uncultured Planococcus sp.]
MNNPTERRNLGNGIVATSPARRREAQPAANLLAEMYAKQTELDTRIITERLVDKSVDEWVIGLTIAMESELDEIRREVNWKWWKNAKPIDKPALRGEVIDMWHFMLSLSRVVGLEPADIHRLYMEKNAENHVRQDGGSAKEGYAL